MKKLLFLLLGLSFTFSIFSINGLDTISNRINENQVISQDSILNILKELKASNQQIKTVVESNHFNWISIILPLFIAFIIAMLAFNQMKINEAIKHRLEWESNFKSDFSEFLTEISFVLLLHRKFEKEINGEEWKNALDEDKKQKWNKEVFERSLEDLKRATFLSEKIELGLSQKQNSFKEKLKQFCDLFTTLTQMYAKAEDCKLEFEELEEKRKELVNLGKEIVDNQYKEIEDFDITQLEIKYR